MTKAPTTIAYVTYVCQSVAGLISDLRAGLCSLACGVWEVLVRSHDYGRTVHRSVWSQTTSARIRAGAARQGDLGFLGPQLTACSPELHRAAIKIDACRNTSGSCVFQ